MRPRTRLLTIAVLVATPLGTSACTPAPVPTPPPVTMSTPTSTPTPSPASPAVDLTRPGAARTAVDALLDAAGTRSALMVAVNATDARVTVLRNGAAQTWALRDGVPKQVQSDTTYVSQAVFDVGRYDLSDVGALFRVAAAVSGSQSRQELQIVDYSAGLVIMTVSTNPESRTVFFHPDGRLLPTLDFRSQAGLSQGFTDAVGTATKASAVGMGSELGVYVDVAGTTTGQVLRRQRSAKFPVVVSPRAEQNPPATFELGLVDVAVVWGVVARLQEQGAYTLDQPWSCVIDDRDALGTPRLHFTVAGSRFTTDLSGRRITP